ncbi:hypothetical protein F2Q70_00039660 [Brassica cretica]|uniref:Uncharacterized protein n=1 Tax=Brassica cretica TaxID=69181 RepID=A0A8S9KBV2_BRACR|nr:hypothetical protein F2Q70_00039660 [Brassica cretica]
MLHTAPTVGKKVLPSILQFLLSSSENNPQKVLPTGTLSTSIGSAASSEGVLMASGGLYEGLGCGLSALRRATSIFGICTRTGRMWLSCCELLVSQDPHGIARCGRLPSPHECLKISSLSFLDQISPILAILAQLGWIQGEMQSIAYVYNS